MQRLRRIFRRPPKTLTSQQAYQLWAKSYPPGAHNPLMQAEQDAMLSVMPTLTAKAVLDLACGSGRYGLMAQAAGARVVVGIDNSPAMLAHNSLKGLAQATTDFLPLPDEFFDVLICALALGHLPEIDAALHEISRVLKRGAVALISDFHPRLFLAGKQRTFSAPDGAIYAVEHYAHPGAAYHAAARAAGLAVEQVLEPALANGAGDLAPGTPVVIVLRLSKL